MNGRWRSDFGKENHLTKKSNYLLIQFIEQGDFTQIRNLSQKLLTLRIIKFAN
jgi:hypothetical protein